MPLFIHSATETPRVFFSSVITYVWYFVIFSTSLLKFSLCSSILFSKLVSIFMAIALNSLSGRLLISTSLRSFFLGSALFFGLESVFSFCLSLCVYLYALGTIATSFSLEVVGLYKSCFMWPKNTVFLGYRPRPSMDIPHVGCMS